MKKTTNYNIIAIILLITTITYSCKKTEDNYTPSSKVNREAIAKQVALHSQGLKMVIKSYQNPELISKSVSFVPLPDNPIDPTIPVTMTQAQTAYSDSELSIKEFLAENSLTEYNSLIYVHLDNPYYLRSPTGSLKANNFTYSADFYLLANQIMDVQGNNLSEISQHIDSILNSNIYFNLSEIEQTILVVGAETYLDSYSFWSSSEAWNGFVPVGSVNQEKNIESKQLVLSKSSSIGNSSITSKIKRYAKADAIGGVAGAIGGAAGGAVIGAFFGGIGAGPGAIQGAIRGGVSAAVSASIGVALYDIFAVVAPVEYAPIATEQTTIQGVTVPIVWDLVPINPFVIINPIDSIPDFNF